MTKLQSRKFWMTLLLVAVSAGLGLSDEALALWALLAATVATVAYTLAQAYVDKVGAANTQVDETLALLGKLAEQIEALVKGEEK